ncbi:MAG: HIT family protein [Candidatus Bathyarchaeota archaeon]|nr:HIT family protein [Candidatus Bathyarchaeota archaeon]
MSESCIFCKIVRKEAPASIVYEDDDVFAFMDIRPVNLGHTLVIPKQHCKDIYETPEELISKTYAITKRLSTAVKKATNADGISIIQQNEKAAGQEVFHLHVHIIPRFKDQKMPNFAKLTFADRKQLEETAQKIKQNL